jgi:hypothetical protein
MSKIYFKGEIPGTAVFSLIRQIITSTKNVKIHFDTPEGFRKTIWVAHGDVLRASSTQYDDRLGEVMYQKGSLSINALVDIAGLLSETKRLGTILIEKKWFSHEEVFSFLKEQSQSVIESLFFFDVLIFEAESWESPTIMPHFPLNFFESKEKSLQNEAAILKRFQKQSIEEPLILLENISLDHLNDFWKDICQVIEEKQNYTKICQEGLRFSNSYSTRFLYALFRGGITKDLSNFTENNLPKTIQVGFTDNLEKLSFLLKELILLAEKNPESKKTLLDSTESFLFKYFGLRHAFKEEEGFQSKTLMRLLLPPSTSCASLSPQLEIHYKTPELLKKLVDLVLMLFNISQDLDLNLDQVKKLKSLMMEYEVFP